MDSELKLEGVAFSEAPTTSQISNFLNDVHRFLSKCAGAMLHNGSYTSADHAMGALLNASIQLKAAAVQFENGPNAQGLAVPQPVPMPMRR